METLLRSERALIEEQLNAEHTWKPLGFLNAYRLFVAGLFVLLPLMERLPSPLGSRDDELFVSVSLAFLGLGGLAAVALWQRRPAFRLQVHLNLLVDIAALTLLMHASGGVTSGLGMLMIVSIAGGSMIAASKTALLYAAVGSLAVLGEQVYSHVLDLTSPDSYPHAGMLGFTFFATAALAYALARRIRDSEALARQRGLDLANMSQLTRYVIRRMQTGIVVVDALDRVRLMNDAAWNMLALHDDTDPLAPVAQVSPELAGQLAAHRQSPAVPAPAFRPTPASAEVQARFAPIGEPRSGTLIFLEETAATAQKAQQLKLASLGRLTASIAHEVRNPLGAIAHAGELLAESERLGAAERKLTRIIEDQSRRVNGIVENILQLSRREASKPVHFDSAAWLERFLVGFLESQAADARDVRLDLRPGLELFIDPSQLEQILTNLLENALRHAEAAERPKIELRSGLTEAFRRPYLDIIDHGPGIPAEAAQYIFEPFYTTEENGTGLGLYISRELAECNQAQITYQAAPGDGSWFRITFQDPRKQIN